MLRKTQWITVAVMVGFVTVSFSFAQWVSADPQKPVSLFLKTQPQPVSPEAALPESLSPTPYQAVPLSTAPTPPTPVGKTRKLPIGTFTKKIDLPPYGEGSITWKYNDDNTVSGTITASGMGVEAELQLNSEISISSHGTVYGVITSAKVSKVKLTGEAAELQPYVGFLSAADGLINEFFMDLPFSYQFRMVDGRMVMHNYRFLLAGPNPVSKFPIIGDASSGPLGLMVYFQMMGSALEGSYEVVKDAK